jgi:translation initiation factor 1
MKKKNTKEGLVYSTNPDLNQLINQEPEIKEVETLPPSQQKLKIYLDTKTKPGKKITVIQGFIGKSKDLETLEKKMKIQFGVGGSTHENEIHLQGDLVAKATEWLKNQGFNVKK